MIYTFYSYKGGVGRSMAMANVAKWLHMQGKSVIVIDWDLEAPGLEGYYFPEDQLEQVKAQKGIMDILSDYKSRYNKFNKEMIRASQEIEAATRRLMDRLKQPDVNWPLIEKNFNTYSAFQKDKIGDIVTQLTALNNNDEISVSQVSQIIQRYISNQDLADEFSIHISDKLQNGKLDPEEVEAYLSTYALFKKDDIEKIINDLKQIDSAELNYENLLKLLREYISEDGSVDDTSGLFNGLGSFKDLLYQVRPPDPNKNNGLWLLPAGKRDGENFTTYSKTVQDFNWTEFYASYNGENYFEWFRKQLESLADIIFIDSRTGVSEMSGVSTRHLADVIVIVTAPNPQNLTGIAKMIKSFVHKDLEEKRQNRKLSVVIVPSRVDVSESLLRNQFQAKFYRTSDEVLGNNLSKDFWELSIPYIPYYNYKEELAVGLSDSPDELEASPQSRELDRAYRKLAAYLVNGTFESQPIVVDKPLQPFIGLKPFQPEDAPLFFGRTNEISRMVDIILSKRFLVLCGPSGSGKSSILRAGLIPSLKNNLPANELAGQSILFLKPGADPFVSLAEAIMSDIEVDKTKLDIKERLDVLAKLFLASPEDFKANIKGALGIEKKYITVIDQFEELFTLCPDQQKREKFINGLSSWISKNETTAILSIRSDFYLELSSYSSIKEKLDRSLFNLETPSEAELRQIILEPAAQAGIRLEQGLVERILKDLEPINNKLAVLQVVLYELWSNRNGNLLTHASYDKINRVDGVQKQRFEGVYKLFSKKELESARPLITRLVNVENYTRQSINFQDIETEQRAVLKPFVDKGLLIVDRDKKTGLDKVQLASDLLISSWPELNEWLISDRLFLAWRQQLNSKLDIWHANNEMTDFLLNKTFTTEAQRWMNQRADELTENEKSFIRQSIESRAKQKRTSRIINVSILAVIGIMLFYILIFKNNTSRTSAVTTSKVDSISQAQAYAFATEYQADNLDADFNLDMLGKYYRLSKKYQDSLNDIRHKIENVIAYRFVQITDDFYKALKGKNFYANTFFSDTITQFGTLRNITVRNIQDRIDSILQVRKIENKRIDTNYSFHTDSAGFYLSFKERGNILIDKLQESKNFERDITIYFTTNLRIKSFTYTLNHPENVTLTSIYTVLKNRQRIDLFICSEQLRDEMNLKYIISVLTDENYSVTRRSFRNPSDPSSPYHVAGNEIRYYGSEYSQALSLQRAFLKRHMDFTLKPVRVSTPNVISVFACGDFKSKSFLRK